MATFGLGNFVYELQVKDGSANFSFRDPEDANNTAEVSVNQSDFPEGINQADSRQVADIAYAQCAKVLNDKRDARIRKEAADELQAKHDEDARQREDAADFFQNAQELADTTPTGGPVEEPKEQKAPAHKAQSQDSVPDDSQDDKSSDKKSK